MTCARLHLPRSTAVGFGEQRGAADEEEVPAHASSVSPTRIAELDARGQRRRGREAALPRTILTTPKRGLAPVNNEGTNMPTCHWITVAESPTVKPPHLPAAWLHHTTSCQPRCSRSASCSGLVLRSQRRSAPPDGWPQGGPTPADPNKAHAEHGRRVCTRNCVRPMSCVTARGWCGTAATTAPSTNNEWRLLNCRASAAAKG